MKRIREVCKIVGVTRRTLQEYNKIGLLSPTGKTESGYWLYDDEAIEKLLLIKKFVEVGYERKQIKKILESEELNLREEFNKAVDLLKAEREEIDNKIEKIEKTIKSMDL